MPSMNPNFQIGVDGNCGQVVRDGAVYMGAAARAVLALERAEKAETSMTELGEKVSALELELDAVCKHYATAVIGSKGNGNPPDQSLPQRVSALVRSYGGYVISQCRRCGGFAPISKMMGSVCAWGCPNGTTPRPEEPDRASNYVHRKIYEQWKERAESAEAQLKITGSGSGDAKLEEWARALEARIKTAEAELAAANREAIEMRRQLLLQRRYVAAIRKFADELRSQFLGSTVATAIDGRLVEAEQEHIEQFGSLPPKADD